MKLHNPEVVGHLTQESAPVSDYHVVRKIDLDNLTSDAAAPIFITAVTPTGAGNTGLATYADTVPANQVVTDIVADTGNLRIHFLAEAGSAYNPTVTYESTEVDFIEEVAGEKRVYSGYHDVVLGDDATVTLVSDTGATASVNIDLQIGGPAIQSLTIGSYPGSQTEVKQGDVLAMTGVVENSATSITVVDSGASQAGTLTLGAVDSAGAGFRTITGNITVANRTGTFPVTITASNLLGTIGTPFDSSNTVVLNQTYPTIGARTINYPAGQTAVKDTQVFTIDSTITNFDTIAYTFERGVVTDDTTYGASKTITVDEAVYDTAAVYSITATRAANGAVSSATTNVYSAGVAAQISITITGSPARLRTSPTGNDYQIVINSNQTMHTTEAPTLVASHGVWQGSWTKSGNTWRRNLRFTDGDAVGSATFSGLSLMNAALIETTTIQSGANYTVGGFTLRTITVPAFAQEVALGLIVGDATKVEAKYGGTQDLLTFRTDTTDAAASFTITNGSGVYTAVGGTHFWLSDVAFAGSNTSGTLQIDIEETP